MSVHQSNDTAPSAARAAGGGAARGAGGGRAGLPVGVGVALDALLVVVFAAIGRRSHDESGALVGVLSTAWPFLAGMATGWLGWLVTVRRGVSPGARQGVPVRRGVPVRQGVPVWLGAVAVGMLLRAATGQGVAASFVVVATVVLGAFLLGWRVIGRLAASRVARRGTRRGTRRR